MNIIVPTVIKIFYFVGSVFTTAFVDKTVDVMADNINLFDKKSEERVAQVNSSKNHEDSTKKFAKEINESPPISSIESRNYKSLMIGSVFNYEEYTEKIVFNPEKDC